MGVPINDTVEQVFARALSIEASSRQKDAGELWRELKGAQSIAFGRPPMDLGVTTRAQQPFDAAPPAAGQDLGGLKSTVRMSQPEVPLFQGPPVRPPPNVPLPAASGSLVDGSAAGGTSRAPDHGSAAGGTSRAPDHGSAAGGTSPNNPALQQTKAPMSARTAARAQWLVGLLVFILVLAAGGVALRFWLLR